MTTNPGGDDDDGSNPQPDPNAAFEVVSKDASLAPGEQTTYCYYFHTSNTEDALIAKWSSHMSPGSHHAILYLNPSGQGQQPDGTLDPSGNCGGFSLQGGAPIWTYATQTEDQELSLPSDDGNRKPLAQKVAAHTPAVLQLHYLNATLDPITAHIDLKAFALPAGTDYTETAAYVTYNQDIAIDKDAIQQPVTASCGVPDNVKFWTISTHSHKQSVKTVVFDGTIDNSSTEIFTSMDWEHPGSKDWMTPQTPFYTFTNTKLSWTCTYTNDGDNHDSVIHAGPSASTNEMCMATGYFFPATAPSFNIQYNGTCYSL